MVVELESGGKRPREQVEWLEPPAEEGLSRYVETIRERWRLVAIAFAATTLFAILYVVTANKTYEAQADLLVTPISGEVGILRSLPLIFESVDPTRDVETASQFVTSLDVAELVKKDTGSDLSPRDLLSKVEAAPVAQSNIVAITAEGDSPEQAQEIANGFADATIDDRTEQVQASAERLLPGVEANLESPSEDLRAQAATDLAQLETVLQGPDPSLRVETEADLPTVQASPRPVLTIAAGMLAGVILGVAGAFAAQALDPRLRREEQLRRLYRLPIIARIPIERRSPRHAPLGPSKISPAGAEAYRTLRATLEARREEGEGDVVLVTGTAPSEGKSTTAVNLAASLALAGREVILIEADLRRPALAQALDVRPSNGGVVSVLLKKTKLEDALTTATGFGPSMRLLLADYSEGWIAELFSIPAARQLIEDARRLAEYVIIDSPPLNVVADAVPLARAADDVLIVVRIGETRMKRISELGELLAENRVRPVGFAVVGVPRPARGESRYYLSEEADREK